MMGRRWARCWTLKADAPYWDRKGSGWLPGNREEGAASEPHPEPTPAKTRVAKRVRLTPRRRIKRTR